MARRGSTAASAPAFVEEHVLHTCQVTGYAPKTKTYDITVHPTQNYGQAYIVQHTLEHFTALETAVRSVVKIRAPFPQKKTWSNPSVEEQRQRMKMLTDWLRELVQRSEHLYPLQSKLFAFLDVHNMILANKPVHAQAELLGPDFDPADGGSSGARSSGGPAVLDFGALAADRMDYTASAQPSPSPSPATKKAPATQKTGMSRAAIAQARRASMASEMQARPQPQARRAAEVPTSTSPPVVPLQATPIESPGHTGRKLVAHALNHNESQPTPRSVARELGVDVDTARVILEQNQQAASQLPAPAPSKAERLARELNVDLATAQRILREEEDAQRKQGELRRLQQAQRQHDLEQEQLRQEELQQGQLHADIQHDAAHQARQAQLAAEEAQQGGPVQTELIDESVEKTLTVTIPEGVSPGHKLKVKYDGSTVMVTVPQGARPGNKLKIRVKAPQRRPSATPALAPTPTPVPAPAPAPAPAPMPVLSATPVQEPVQTLIQVPPGCKGGDKVHLDLADGRKIEIVLPPGVSPGMQVAVMVPP